MGPLTQATCWEIMGVFQIRTQFLEFFAVSFQYCDVGQRALAEGCAFCELSSLLQWVNGVKYCN